MQENQRITVSDRKSVEVDNISSVRAFDEDGVLLESPLGKISVEGRELKIENFEKATGRILISGSIIGVF
jgi:sporulation protein YabP